MSLIMTMPSCYRVIISRDKQKKKKKKISHSTDALTHIGLVPKFTVKNIFQWIFCISYIPSPRILLYHLLLSFKLLLTKFMQTLPEKLTLTFIVLILTTNDKNQTPNYSFITQKFLRVARFKFTSSSLISYIVK